MYRFNQPENFSSFSARSCVFLSIFTSCWSRQPTPCVKGVKIEERQRKMESDFDFFPFLRPHTAATVCECWLKSKPTERRKIREICSQCPSTLIVWINKMTFKEGRQISGNLPFPNHLVPPLSYTLFARFLRNALHFFMLTRANFKYVIFDSKSLPWWWWSVKT